MFLIHPRTFISPPHTIHTKATPTYLSTENVVNITPIITRHAGHEYAEAGAGGGHGDLSQIHELELTDVAAVGSLMELCGKHLQDKPELLQRVLGWLGKSVKSGGRNVRIDTERFFEAVYGLSLIHI